MLTLVAWCLTGRALIDELQPLHVDASPPPRGDTCSEVSDDEDSRDVSDVHDSKGVSASLLAPVPQGLRKRTYSKATSDAADIVEGPDMC